MRERSDGVAVVADLGDGLGPPINHHERVGGATHAHASHRSTEGVKVLDLHLPYYISVSRKMRFGNLFGRYISLNLA